MALRAVFEIEVFSPLLILNRVRENNIEIADFHEVGPYKFRFKASKSYQKKLFQLFPGIELVSDPFPIHIIKSLIAKKIDLVALVVALVSFYFLSTRIYRVEIKGNDPVIGLKIQDYLDSQGINRFSLIPSDADIAAMDRNIMRTLSTDLESLEIAKVGGSIYVKYEKKRDPVILPELEKNLYANRQGIVTRIEVTYGTCLVKVGDMVERGDLLITGSYLDTDKKAIEGFAKGKIYARTWYDLQVSCPHSEIGENYGNLLALGDGLVLTKEKTLIDRLILSYEEKNDTATMNLHYTVEENIAFWQN